MAQPRQQRFLRQAGGHVIAAAVLAGLVACAGDQSRQEAAVADTPQDTCGRAEAAARFSMVFFDTMGDMGEACSEGDVLACNPANYAIGTLAGVVYMPVGFLIGLASPEVEAYQCAAARRQPAARTQPETPEEKRARLWVRAAEDDAGAQFEVGEQLFAEQSADSRRAAWYWYCRAAHQRHAEAQYRLGDYYRTGRDPARHDLHEAYLWYELAADQRISAAAEARAAVAAGMGAAEIARAERRAAAWQPTPDDCRFDSAADMAVALERTGGDGP